MSDVNPAFNKPSKNPDDFETTVLAEDLEAVSSGEANPNATTDELTAKLRQEDAGSFLDRFFRAAGDGLVTNTIAILGAVTTLAGYTVPGVVLAALAVAFPLFVRRESLRDVNRSINPTGTFLIARVLLTVVLATLYPADRDDAALVWLGAAGIAILIAAEGSVVRVARGAIPFAAHVPGVEVRNRRWVSPGWVFVANVTALVLFGVICIVDAPGFLALLLAVLIAPLTAVVLVDGTLRIRQRRIAERTLNERLAEYGARFLVHWDAPRGTLYQLAMWMPYLERLGVPFLVVVRHPGNFNGATELTDRPVLLRRALTDMDAVVTPSLKTAFYVNTAAKNVHFIRYTNLNHIQLNHGDSDKAPSYNRVFRMYDRNFVAGQAAIDRFAQHGITMRDDMFVIVGRPQVEDVNVATAPISTVERPTVLYAPTWSGFYVDTNYSSLSIGRGLIENLIRRGCRVVFRPHPYTRRNKSLAAEAEAIEALLEADARGGGQPHVWGKAATEEMSVVDCFNASDAMITDVSSVAADYLYSEKPFAITAMTAPAAELMNEFPVARASYIIDPKSSTWDPVLDDLLKHDTQAARRHELKVYYLGDFPTDRYADAFLDAARKYI